MGAATPRFISLLRRCHAARVGCAGAQRLLARVGMRWLLAVGLACAVAACGDNLGPPEPDELFTSPTDLTLEIGQTAELAAHYSNDFAPSDITWTSTNTAVVTVAGQGEHATVTAVAPGTATIAAEGQGRVGQVHVTVNPAHL